MALLQDIQYAIIDSDRPLAGVLRMAMVLAARLDNPMLQEWAERELNGYPEDAPLPPYRATRQARVLGNFSGPFGLQAENMPIAPFQVDTKFHDMGLFEVAFRDAVAAYEALLEGDDEGRGFQVPWPAGAVPITRPRVLQEMECVTAWKAISRGELVAVLDGVRNRLLSLVLQLEREAPEAGQVPSSSLSIPSEQVNRLVQMNIYAGSTSVTDNSIRVQGTAGSITAGKGNRVRQGDVSISQQGIDLGALLDALRAAVGQLNGQLTPEQVEAAQGLVEELEEEATGPTPLRQRMIRTLGGIAAIATAGGAAGTAVVDAAQAIQRALAN